MLNVVSFDHRNFISLLYKKQCNRYHDIMKSQLKERGKNDRIHEKTKKKNIFIYAHVYTYNCR